MSSVAPGSAASAEMVVRRVAPADLLARDIEAWVDLESRAAEPNAFLSPHFVLPALRHLDKDSRAAVFLVERIGAGSRETVCVGVVGPTRGSKFLPFPHLVAYRSRDSYLSGLLIDRDRGAESLVALIEHLRRHERGCWGIEVPLVWAEGPFASAAAAATARGSVVFPGAELEERALLVLADAGPPLLERVLGRQRKDVERRMRRLGERGEVGWRWHRENGIPATAVEAFLALEHAGWKGEEGTSMRSLPAYETFFREVVAGFGAEGRALFTELTVDGVPIASTSNFVSGGAGFAFKIGWDPAFKAFSPGLLNELEFIRRAGAAFPDIEYFDSGADAGSFINRLWPSRRRMGTIVVPTTAVARVAIRAASWLREVKHGVKAPRRAAPASPANDPESDL
jgi:hypothetical protein